MQQVCIVLTPITKGEDTGLSVDLLQERPTAQVKSQVSPLLLVCPYLVALTRVG